MLKKIVILLVFNSMFHVVRADNNFTIQVGKNPQSYSVNELKKRVWNLERAVARLQRQVYHGGGWVCTISKFGTSYSATGNSRAEARMNVIEKCKSERKDAFFCKDERCKK